MSPPDDLHQLREEHHERIRLTKRILRFMPRRALFHKYPFIGRFAARARKRAYLWSFKSNHVRPALYLGSILACQPVMGVQLPVAFLCALLLRLNVMVFGGLQFVSNPFTAAPLYYGTYKIGLSVIEASGFGDSIDVASPVVETKTAPDAMAATPDDQGDPTLSRDTEAPPPKELRWTQRMGTSINALVLGGILVGTALGGVLDLLWSFGTPRANAYRLKLQARRHHSVSTDPPPPTL